MKGGRQPGRVPKQLCSWAGQLHIWQQHPERAKPVLAATDFSARGKGETRGSSKVSPGQGLSAQDCIKETAKAEVTLTSLESRGISSLWLLDKPQGLRGVQSCLAWRLECARHVRRYFKCSLQLEPLLLSPEFSRSLSLSEYHSTIPPEVPECLCKCRGGRSCRLGLWPETAWGCRGEFLPSACWPHITELDPLEMSPRKAGQDLDQGTIKMGEIREQEREDEAGVLGSPYRL